MDQKVPTELKWKKPDSSYLDFEKHAISLAEKGMDPGHVAKTQAESESRSGPKSVQTELKRKEFLQVVITVQRETHTKAKEISFIYKTE
jgi:hypothetical protein